MPDRSVSSDSKLDRVSMLSLAALLVVVWFGGGVTVDVTSTDEVLVLLSLPVLALVLHRWLHTPAPVPLMRAALLAAALNLLVPLLQWVLPVSLGSSGRMAIETDLAKAGIASGLPQGSLTPQATEHALWVLLPPLACFLGAALLDTHGRRRSAQLIVTLVLANLAFGLFQAGLPEGHAMRLYTNSGSGFGGVLINGNHQASALVIGMLLALGLGAEARRRSRHGEDRNRQANAWLLAAVTCLLAIPIAGSSAGMLLGIVFAACGVAATGLLGSVREGRSINRVAQVVIAVFALVGIVIASQWMDLAQTDPLRHAAARETWVLGTHYVPLGSGVGSFVQMFQQAAGPLFDRGEYVNHAHNEYAQWWLEGGLLAVVAALAVFAVLAWIGWRLLRDRHHRPLGVACWLGLVALLLHSIVDFPLRTLSLMTLAGLLAGLAVADAARPRESRRRVPTIHRDDAAQQA